jgi:hypothetical protein
MKVGHYLNDLGSICPVLVTAIFFFLANRSESVYHIEYFWQLGLLNIVGTAYFT